MKLGGLSLLLRRSRSLVSTGGYRTVSRCECVRVGRFGAQLGAAVFCVLGQRFGAGGASVYRNAGSFD